MEPLTKLRKRRGVVVFVKNYAKKIPFFIGFKITIKIVLIKGSKMQLYFASSSANQIRTPRVLSIQSHTVHGFVGNKASTFPLQVLGFNVDALNNVHYSNHPGYKEGYRGTSLEPSEITNVFEGLQLNNLIDYDIILSGYSKSVDMIFELENVIKKVREINNDVLYVCDPVLGDNGRFYVPDTLLEAYKTKLIPIASVVTPNQFEAEVITGIKITNQGDSVRACEVFHSLGVEICLLKGISFESAPNDINAGGGVLETEKDSNLSMVLSYRRKPSRHDAQTDARTCHVHAIRIDVPKIAGMRK